MFPKFDILNMVEPRTFGTRIPFHSLAKSIKVSNCKIIYICMKTFWYLCVLLEFHENITSGLSLKYLKTRKQGKVRIIEQEKRRKQNTCWEGKVSIHNHSARKYWPYIHPKKHWLTHQNKHFPSQHWLVISSFISLFFFLFINDGTKPQVHGLIGVVIKRVSFRQGVGQFNQLRVMIRRENSNLGFWMFEEKII